MLKLNTPVDTPQGLSLTGTVWRWAGVNVDALRHVGLVTVCVYPSLALALAAEGESPPSPLFERAYPVIGMDFYTFATAVSQQPTNADALNTMIYGFLRATVPLFADAEDVGL